MQLTGPELERELPNGTNGMKVAGMTQSMTVELDDGRRDKREGKTADRRG